MSNIKHPNEMRLASAGRPGLLEPAAYNGLVTAARKEYSIKKGISNGLNLYANKENEIDRDYMHVLAHEDIPQRSVFSIQSGGLGYSLAEPYPQTDKITEENFGVCVYLTNPHYALNTGANYYLPLCGLARPYIFSYDSSGGTPAIGDSIGPLAGSYKMSLASQILGFTVVSAPDTLNELVWCVKVACDSDTALRIEMFEFTETLHPGRVAAARMLKWSPTNEEYELDPTNTTSYKLFDPEEQNFFLETERTHAVKKILHDEQGVKFADYEIIGEHGLRRQTLLSADIECGSSGAGSVQQKSGTKLHPPTLDPSCAVEDTGEEIIACNRLGNRRKMLESERVHANYDHGRQAWVYDQEDRPNLLEAILEQDMCPSDDVVNVTDVTHMDWLIDGCWDTPGTPYPTVTQVKNSKNLAGLYQDTVFLRRYEGREGADEWHIVQVQHHEESILTDISFGGQSSICPTLEYIPSGKAAIMYCELPTSTPLGRPVPVITDAGLNPSSCEWDFEVTEVCVLGIGSSVPHSITMQEIDVITEVEKGSCGLILSGKTICGIVKGNASFDPVNFDKINVFDDIVVDKTNCRITLTGRSICAIDDGAGIPGRIDLEPVDTLTGVTVANPADEDCTISFSKETICGIKKDPSPSPDTIDIRYEEVGTGIHEGASCVELEKKSIPVIDACASVSKSNETIYCVEDCDDVEPAVNAEINTNGTYNLDPNETQPYDSSSATSITFNMPTTGLTVGDVVRITNNGLSSNPVTINGGSFNVQALSAPYTAASIELSGPRLSITYQYRQVPGSPTTYEWRII